MGFFQAYAASWCYYMVFMIPPLLLALWAQNRVRSAFGKYSQVETERHITGAQVARELLDSQGLQEVKVEKVEGRLSDHYDPRAKVLRLSPDVHDKRSVAAAGVAAHETGHAVQDKDSYTPLKIRSAIVPAVNIGTNLGLTLFFVGFMLNICVQGSGQIGFYIAAFGLILFGATIVFTLITLPVEIDASKRAKKLLVAEGIMYQDEMEGVNRVLDAAAWTYVAAAFQAIMQFLYYASILARSRE